jgi:hypothetical protein
MARNKVFIGVRIDSSGLVWAEQKQETNAKRVVKNRIASLIVLEK